jgi:hypothetical protein
MNELDRENKELCMRVSQLKVEMKNLYEQSVNKYEENLNSINWSQIREPTGESAARALREQQEIQNCLKNSLGRLEKVEKKIEGMAKEKEREKVSRVPRLT